MIWCATSLSVTYEVNPLQLCMFVRTKSSAKIYFSIFSLVTTSVTYKASIKLQWPTKSLLFYNLRIFLKRRY